MFIRLDNEGNVSIVEDGAATYQASADEFAADAPDVVPSMPPGFSMVSLETGSGVITGYDSKGNAFPGIEWDNAADLVMRVSVLKSAHLARQIAAGEVAPEMVRPKEVVSDTEDIATKTEVTIL